MDEKKLIELTGTVEDITFKSDETGWTVLTLDVGGEPIVVVGEMFSVNEGEEIHVYGNYVNHPQYGVQFKSQMCEIKLPNNVNTIFKYLQSGAIKGIGPATARRIVDKFGADSLDIIAETPHLLTTIKGITTKKAEEIAAEFQKIFGLRTAMLFFAEYGINTTDSIKIYKKFGTLSVDVIKTNPYVLCGFDFQFDFFKADDIAKKLGFNDSDYLRVSAGLKFVLMHNSGNGHTCLPIDKLIETAAKLTETDNALVNASLKELLLNGEITVCELNGKKFVFLTEFFTVESFIAERLSFADSIMSGAGERANSSLEKTIQKQISDQEKKLGFCYADLQKEAILRSAVEGAFVLTGGPGTGKTTTIKGMINCFEFLDKKILLAAPTGRAAKRLSEVTGKEAKTIHRLLEVDPNSPSKFKHNQNNKLDCDVVILDEVSMVDIHLFKSLLEALSVSTKIVLVGDSDQLPSVGPGNILNDIINSGMVATVSLNTVFRQAAESLIVTNAHNIIKGKLPVLDSTDNDFFFLPGSGDLMRKVGTLYSERLPKAYGYNPFEDIQIISPSKRGRFGTHSINEYLRDLTNGRDSTKPEVKIKSVVLRVGDKVIQTRNNYDIVWHRNGKEGTGIFNGDIGFIIEIDKKEQLLLVQFDDRVAAYNYEYAEDLELAYAITVHKSQGSEYNAVILVLGDCFQKLMFRNLLYTAVTRAKKQLIIVGNEELIEAMVNNNKKSLRYTGLKYLLTGEFLVFPEL